MSGGGGGACQSLIRISKHWMVSGRSNKQWMVSGGSKVDDGVIGGAGGRVAEEVRRGDGDAWAVNPGDASLAGLGWLAGVGPAPLSAWEVAMGWQRDGASHAVRLVRAGFIDRTTTTHGGESLYFATRRGVEMARLKTAHAGISAGADDMGASCGVRVDGGVADRSSADDGWAARVAGRG